MRIEIESTTHPIKFRKLESGHEQRSIDRKYAKVQFTRAVMAFSTDPRKFRSVSAFLILFEANLPTRESARLSVFPRRVTSTRKTLVETFT